jgi:DNA-binding GntR family transcriptional regulator
VYDDLAKRLQMSRTPIINALNRLEQHGLVASESYRGFTVRPMDNKEAWDSFGFREAIETFAVEQAIYNADEKQFDLLEEKVIAYDEHRSGYYDRKKIFTDIAIHNQIAEMAKNQVLKWHLKLTLQHIYMRARLNNYSLERLETAQAEHHTLVSRMRNKDVLGSIEVMRNHVHYDRSHVIACISGVSAEPIDDDDLMI